MNKTLIFILGGITGSLITWKFVKDKYKKIADEEIESVIEVFNRRKKELEEKYKISPDENIEHCAPDYDNVKDESYPDEKEYDSDEEVEVIDMYNKKVQDLGYTAEIVDLNKGVKPYIISPEEFGEEIGYEEVSMLYCSDKILLDEDDIVVDSPEEIIGDALKEFSDIWTEAVYVRNENEKIDYEILRSEKRSDEITQGPVEE